jgi:hypothetical protein
MSCCIPRNPKLSGTYATKRRFDEFKVDLLAEVNILIADSEARNAEKLQKLDDEHKQEISNLNLRLAEAQRRISQIETSQPARDFDNYQAGMRAALATFPPFVQPSTSVVPEPPMAPPPSPSVAPLSSSPSYTLEDDLVKIEFKELDFGEGSFM